MSNHQYISQFDAFRLGYRDAARLIRWGFQPASISPRKAEELRPRLAATVAGIAAYLNGWADGSASDGFRLQAIADCESKGLRF